MEPLTTVTLASSSLVPWPNELSPVPLARSTPSFRPESFCQSVVPKVVGLVCRLPSAPAKVLPASGGRHDCVVPVAAKSQPLALSAKLVEFAQPTPNAGTSASAAPIATHFFCLLNDRIHNLPRP